MGVVRTYRDLMVWQRGMELARAVYTQTAKMPPAERFGLTSQMRRAVVSVPSNIAEGYARQTSVEYLRFLRIARGSLAELATQHELAIGMNLMPEDTRVVSLLRELDRMLQSLIQKIEARIKAKKQNP